MPADDSRKSVRSSHTDTQEKDAVARLNEPLFTMNFMDPSLASERAMFFKVLIVGFLGMVFIIFAFFSIYWGALWKVPAHQLPGWVIDYDGEAVGQAVSQGLLASSAQSKIAWQVVSGMRPSEVPELVHEHKTWIAIVSQYCPFFLLQSAKLIGILVNANATLHLQTADNTYDPTSAITVYGVEARNENAYRGILRPVSESTLQAIYNNFARQRISEISSDAVSLLASTSPQALAQPLAHTLVNLAPFSSTLR